MPDIAKLRAALDAIKRYPEHHDQGVWSTGGDFPVQEIGRAHV